MLRKYLVNVYFKYCCELDVTDTISKVSIERYGRKIALLFQSMNSENEKNPSQGFSIYFLFYSIN